MLSLLEEEQEKIRAYNEFYKQHKELFVKKPREFACLQRVYVEKKLEQIRYGLKNGR